MFALDNAFDLNLRRFLHWNGTINILAILIGCSLLGASVLPWVKDPLGGVYSAWQLPLYSGWGYPVDFLNYGLLCFCCALYAFLFACTDWHPYSEYKGCFVYGHRIIRLIPVVPVILFMFQYLCVDISAISLLAKHEQQMLLIQQYFGYQGSTSTRYAPFAHPEYLNALGKVANSPQLRLLWSPLLVCCHLPSPYLSSLFYHSCSFCHPKAQAYTGNFLEYRFSDLVIYTRTHWNAMQSMLLKENCLLVTITWP